MPLSPVSSTAPMGSSPFSNSWSSGWNPSFSNTWHASWSGTWRPSWTATWHPTWTGTWSGNTWSHTWSPTWSNTWSHTWAGTWSHTWSTYTQSYPTYTWTQNTWTQYVPSYPQGCYPNDPYCNGYYLPSYPPYYPYYQPGYVQVQLSPTASAPGDHVSVQGSGFLPTDTSCTISSPASPDLIVNGTVACVVQNGTGMVFGGFIVGNVPPGSYLVQLTGNEGDFAQAIIAVE